MFSGFLPFFFKLARANCKPFVCLLSCPYCSPLFVILYFDVQAVIKMDDGGTFYIKNIGKPSIFVNSKEVPCNKRISLISDSLLEVWSFNLFFLMQLCQEFPLHTNSSFGDKCQWCTKDPYPVQYYRYWLPFCYIAARL